MNFSDDPRNRVKIKSALKIKKKIKRDKFKLPAGYRWYKCQMPSWDVPDRGTGTPIGLNLGGFKFDDSDAAYWELVPKDLPLISLHRLRLRFFHEARWWRKPVAWLRNPEKEGMPIYGPTDIILVLYSGGYFISIDRTEIFGPHAAHLYYRSRNVPDEVVWVAVVQIEAMWHSDERMLKELNGHIRNRNLYQSRHTGEQVVLQ